jgi:hypothetical protein
LRVADRTYKWRKWVEWCRRCNVLLTIIVHPTPKEVFGEESSSQPSKNKSGCCGDVPFDQLEIREEGGTQREEIDVDDVVDGGERIQGIVEDLEAVDRNAIEVNLNMEDDMDDEDEEEDDNMATQAPVPEEWNRPDVSSMEAMVRHESRYQYGCSMIEQDQLFPNKQELKDTVSQWAVTSLREVFVKVSSPSKYSVKCRAPGCAFYVHAYKPKNEIPWIASIMQNHSYTLQNLGRRHRNLTASLVANELYSDLIKKRDMECSFIQRAVRGQFKYEITYQKTWRAKRIALKKRWGLYEASYCNLP